MWRRIGIVSFMAIGSFMLAITSNHLGEQGNKVLNVVGFIFLAGAWIAFFRMRGKD